MVARPWSSSRLSCGERLLLRCDGNAGNSFPTTEGKDPSSPVGDSENDIPMFEVVHRSYCIDHTSPIVKEHSDYVVESVEKVIELELNRE